ncbi:hypothetical protein Agub_g15963, partial [Astrephomene gubernaculifera]
MATSSSQGISKRDLNQQRKADKSRPTAAVPECHQPVLEGDPCFSINYSEHQYARFGVQNPFFLGLLRFRPQQPYDKSSFKRQRTSSCSSTTPVDISYEDAAATCR